MLSKVKKEVDLSTRTSDKYWRIFVWFIFRTISIAWT